VDTGEALGVKSINKSMSLFGGNLDDSPNASLYSFKIEWSLRFGSFSFVGSSIWFVLLFGICYFLEKLISCIVH
jgi:hypothetical protein